MARTYHIDIAAFAADVDRKWVDNLVSHFDVEGVERARRGVARRITTAGLYRIALIRRLNTEVGIAIASAVRLADRLLGGSQGAVAVAAGLELSFDQPAFEMMVDARIAEAVDAFRPAVRGRPPSDREDIERREAR